MRGSCAGPITYKGCVARAHERVLVIVGTKETRQRGVSREKEVPHVIESCLLRSFGQRFTKLVHLIGVRGGDNQQRSGA